MAELRTTPQEILLPVKPGFIAVTLLAALLLNLLPWSGHAILVKPDFVALIVLYWCIEAPRRIGFLAAWLLGLVMDVADGTLLGQHALAYTILAYAGIALHRRVRMFAVTPQVLHVVALLVMTDLVVIAVRVIAGADAPGLLYFAGSLAGGALWPVLGLVLKLPQRPQSDPDHA
ncbi:MAG: rod shape-determining protein MreD [Burkholderiales bacterium]|nr:rod shape-determining protein MreD [Burkholderiales bacterium]